MRGLLVDAGATPAATGLCLAVRTAERWPMSSADAIRREVHTAAYTRASRRPTRGSQRPSPTAGSSQHKRGTRLRRRSDRYRPSQSRVIAHDPHQTECRGGEEQRYGDPVDQHRIGISVREPVHPELHVGVAPRLLLRGLFHPPVQVGRETAGPALDGAQSKPGRPRPTPAGSNQPEALNGMTARWPRWNRDSSRCRTAPCLGSAIRASRLPGWLRRAPAPYQRLPGIDRGSRAPLGKVGDSSSRMRAMSPRHTARS